MTDENEPPPISKLTRSKERWAREGRFLTGKISRPEEQREIADKCPVHRTLTSEVHIVTHPAD
jgi:hypothetical protein